jgi:hypothetical protein
MKGIVKKLARPWLYASLIVLVLVAPGIAIIEAMTGISISVNIDLIIYVSACSTIIGLVLMIIAKNTRKGMAGITGIFLLVLAVSIAVYLAIAT